MVAVVVLLAAGAFLVVVLTSRRWRGSPVRIDHVHEQLIARDVAPAPDLHWF